MFFSYGSQCQIVFAKIFLQMQQPIRLVFSPSISFDFRRSVQAFLEMFLTDPSLHWRSVEKSDALAIATPRIAAESLAHCSLVTVGPDEMQTFDSHDLKFRSG